MRIKDRVNLRYVKKQYLQAYESAKEVGFEVVPLYRFKLAVTIDDDTVLISLLDGDTVVKEVPYYKNVDIQVEEIEMSLYEVAKLGEFLD